MFKNLAIWPVREVFKELQSLFFTMAMNRRIFIKQMALSVPILGVSPLGVDTAFNIPCMKLKKPKKLRIGNTIGLVAPASSVHPQKLQKAVLNIESLGLRVELGKNSKNQKGFLAGSDEERLADIHHFFSRKDIDGIWCLRGGYGSARILNRLDYKLIQQNPKVFIGYSDITAMLNAIYQKTKLLTFHGPVATSDFTPYSVDCLRASLMSSTPHPMMAVSESKEVIFPGKATGPLVGGNLSLIAALCGSDYLPRFKNKIIFLEDIGEKPYRIDRMLTQLLMSTDIADAAGIILGVFEDCEANSNDKSFNLQEVFHNRLSSLEIPTMYGLPFGHIADNTVLPVGADALMDTDTGRVDFLENAVLE